jgi:hypothetical protein
MALWRCVQKKSRGRSVERPRPKMAVATRYVLECGYAKLMQTTSTVIASAVDAVFRIANAQYFGSAA